MAIKTVSDSFANTYFNSQFATNQVMNRYYNNLVGTSSIIGNLPVRPTVQYGDFNNFAVPFLSAFPVLIGKSPRLAAYGPTVRFGSTNWPYGTTGN